MAKVITETAPHPLFEFFSTPSKHHVYFSYKRERVAIDWTGEYAYIWSSGEGPDYYLRECFGSAIITRLGIKIDTWLFGKKFRRLLRWNDITELHCSIKN